MSCCAASLSQAIAILAKNTWPPRDTDRANSEARLVVFRANTFALCAAPGPTTFPFNPGCYNPSFRPFNDGSRANSSTCSMVRATLVRLDLADAEIPGENFSPLMQRVKEVPKSLISRTDYRRRNNWSYEIKRLKLQRKAKNHRRFPLESTWSFHHESYLCIANKTVRRKQCEN